MNNIRLAKQNKVMFCSIEILFFRHMLTTFAFPMSYFCFQCIDIDLFKGLKTGPKLSH